MPKITDKIKEKIGAVDNLSKFKKFTKLESLSYIEYIIIFPNLNLHEGYFCYNCIYWINAGGGKCMIVEESGHDVLGKAWRLLLHPMVATLVMSPIMASYMIQEFSESPDTKH